MFTIVITYVEIFGLLVFAAILIAGYRWDRNNKPSKFYKLRNKFQKIVDPDLSIRGYGDLYISYTYADERVVEYFTSARKHRLAFEQLEKEQEYIQNLEQGVITERDWQKWGNKEKALK